MRIDGRIAEELARKVGIVLIEQGATIEKASAGIAKEVGGVLSKFWRRL